MFFKGTASLIFGDGPSLITETGCCWAVSTEIINAEAKRLPPGKQIGLLWFPNSSYVNNASKQERGVHQHTDEW